MARFQGGAVHKELQVKIRLRSDNPYGNLFFHGLALCFRNWSCLTWLYAVNVIFSLLVLLPFSRTIPSLLTNALAMRGIFGSANAAFLGMLIRHPRSVAAASLAEIVILCFTLAEFAAFRYLTGGILDIYLTGVPSRLSTLLARGKKYFWRFVRISCLEAATVGALIAAGIEGGKLIARGTRLHLSPVRLLPLSSRTWELLALIAALAGASLLRLWFDTVEVYTVRGVLPGDRSILRTIGPASRTLVSHFPSIFSGFFLADIAGLGFLSACVSLWKDLAVNGYLWTAWLVSQAGLMFLLTARLWQRGIEVSLVNACGSSCLLTKRHLRNPEAPAEPSLQQLVAKLQDDPWKVPEPLQAAPRLRPAQPGRSSLVDLLLDAHANNHAGKVRLPEPGAPEASPAPEANIASASTAPAAAASKDSRPNRAAVPHGA